MNILFLSISQAVSNINNRGIYPDLLRKFKREGHCVFIVCPSERRLKRKTELIQEDNLSTLCVKTLNITKTNIIEKGIATILLDYQYARAIKKYFSNIHFDLILYSTPPITLNSVVEKAKLQNKVNTYLLLKDIFPQNALDLNILTKWNPLYWFFRRKEKRLYHISDIIGCMSPANVKYILKHNPKILKEQVEVCPNSIEIQTEKSLIDKEAIRTKYNIPLYFPVLIYGGNIGKPQGIDFLIEVLKSNVNRSDLFFIIAGSGTEYKKLDTWYKQEKPKNILLLPAVPKDDFDKLIQVSNVGLIFLDNRYTIPNYPSRLLSYLENKIPVLMATDVNTDIGPIAEKNGYGFWVKSGDLNSFNIKLQTLILNPELRINMGEKAYQFLLKEYTVDISYNIIMKHFKKN